MQGNLDTLALDLSDSEALNEYFSRKEPGDTCKLKIDQYELTATVQEVESGKMVILNLDKEDVPESEDEEYDSKESKSEPVDEVLSRK